MKKTLIIAGLISAAGLATAAPAVADSPDSTVSCSPMPQCKVIDPNSGRWQGNIADFVVHGPKVFQDSVGDFVTKGPTTFVNSVNDLVTNGPKTFSDSITNPGGSG
jgi:opacity protein-like surface antigen